MNNFSGPCTIICGDGNVAVSEEKLKAASSFFATERGRIGKAGVILEDLDLKPKWSAYASMFC